MLIDALIFLCLLGFIVFSERISGLQEEPELVMG